MTSWASSPARHWLEHRVLVAGHLPLLALVVGLVVSFAGTRVAVRMIRARDHAQRAWPRDLRPGGLHIHHVVLGIVVLVGTGVALVADPAASIGTRTATAALFGIGAGLVLDEFALVLHLEDVYWDPRGRSSLDAVSATAVVCLLLLAGLTPFARYGWRVDGHLLDPALVVLTLALGAVALLKGKFWSAVVGLFVPLLLVPAALRLSRPDAPWARRRYADRDPVRQRRAQVREHRVHVPATSAKTHLQELLAGRHDLEPGPVDPRRPDQEEAAP